LAGLLISDPNDASELRSVLQSWRRDLENLRAAVLPVSEMLRRRTWDTMAAEIAECVQRCS
jgi:hypothetical protein